jgi:methionyl-tRNA formyltransferase
MRIVFAGTPVFAALVLQELLRRNYDIVSVLTQPDSASGRGLKPVWSAVKQLAVSRDIAVHQPSSLKDAGALGLLSELRPDLLVVVAYGLILPAAILSLPRLGCINVHASLLPRWRGAAPIQRAIMAGDRETGVCIMRMEAGLDTGPVYVCRSTPIRPDDTAGSLHDRLAALGAEALCAVLERMRREGPLQAEPQAEQGVTYAAKILKGDARIDWSRPVAEIERLMRALDPAPGASTSCRGQPLKLWRSGVVAAGADAAPPGTVIAAGQTGIDVRGIDGVLRVTEVQRAGGKRMPAGEFLRGFPLAAGDRFGD